MSPDERTRIALVANKAALDCLEWIDRLQFWAEKRPKTLPPMPSLIWFWLKMNPLADWNHSFAVADMILPSAYATPTKTAHKETQEAVFELFGWLNEHETFREVGHILLNHDQFRELIGVDDAVVVRALLDFVLVEFADKKPLLDPKDPRCKQAIEVREAFLADKEFIRKIKKVRPAQWNQLAQDLWRQAVAIDTDSLRDRVRWEATKILNNLPPPAERAENQSVEQEGKVTTPETVSATDRSSLPLRFPREGIIQIGDVEYPQIPPRRWRLIKFVWGQPERKTTVNDINRSKQFSKGNRTKLYICKEASEINTKVFETIPRPSCRFEISNTKTKNPTLQIVTKV